MVMCFSIVAPLALMAASASEAAPASGGAYEPSWESLQKHRVPEWFCDAKFGIYTHWGPITVATSTAPAEMEWYARQMYEPNHPAFAYHRSRFGDQRTVGYKDVIPLFKADTFDAEAWAKLFAEAGARFAGPVAIHHDNFALWDSAHFAWNSKRMGPRRDITGELAKAIRGHGLRFIATFHHGFAWRYYEPAYAYDAASPEHAALYCEPHAPDAPPPRAYLDRWLAGVNEVVEKYEPDLIWFDFCLGSVVTPEYQRRMFADYYRWAERHGREVGVAHKHPEIHRWTGILDFERGREDRLTEYPWLTDTSIGPWFHHQSIGYKSADDIIDVLVDIVSKNGCMLLNVGPDADGTIPAAAQELLREIGAWLKVNGEAIFETRPWKTFGEGPTRNAGGGFSEARDARYGAGDIRFTRSKDGATVYAIALDWPGGEVAIRSMRVESAGPQASVRLLGYEKPLRFRLTVEKTLVIETPNLSLAERPCRYAFALKLSGFTLSLGDDARFEGPGAVALLPDKATFEGKKIQTQTNEGRLNIGFWDDAGERIHWLASIAKPRAYLIRVEVSSAYGPSALRLECGEQSCRADVPQTEGWFKPVMVKLGRIEFEKPGVYHLVLGPVSPGTWKAVNVYQVQLAPAD